MAFRAASPRRSAALLYAVVIAFGHCVAPRVCHAGERVSAPGAVRVSGELDVNSHYVWHGIEQAPGMVLNPSLTLARGAWSLSAWGNVLRDLHAPRALDEVDYALTWGTHALGFDLEPTVLLYSYPNTGARSTWQLELGAKRALVGPLSTFTRQSVDLREAPGAVFSAVGMAFELPERAHVTLAGSAQYGRGWWRFASAYASPELEGMNVAGASLAATVDPGAGFTLRPHLDWYRVGNRPVCGTITGSSPFVVGLALGGTF